jgi:predicted AlkP superfamily phosphohydrolase/phosphomutase
MLWRSMDPGHPAYNEATDGPYKHVIEDLYLRFDGIVGRTLDRTDRETMLVVMSDHGFTSWRRAFHLNSWLEQQGYLAVRDPQRRRGTLFSDVDWSRTRAYGLGLNGLYVNVRGREKSGIVEPSDRAALAREIGEKLVETIDPATGLAVVTRVYPREQVYASVRYPDITPDLIVGYAKGTRCSNQSALGEVPAEILVDNKEQWSGDHCMDHVTVPGILLTSRRLARPAPSLRTLASSILVEFGVDDFAVEPSHGTN